MKKFSPQLLRSLRNDIPVDDLIRGHLKLPCKHREGFFRFLCPVCRQFNTATNPKTNLARCFACQRNFNTIDLVIILKECSFTQAVHFLRNLPQTRLPGK